MTYLTGSSFFALLGGYLFIMSYFLWPFQAYFNQLRSPFLCPIGTAIYQFPAMEMFYISSIFTMVICYTIFYRGRPGWMTWGTMVFVFGAAAFALCFFQFNAWNEVLMSAGIGIFTTAIFMVHVVFFFAPALPYLEPVPPFCTFRYCDDMGWGVNSKKYPKFYECRDRLHALAKYNPDRWKLVSKND